MPQPITRFHAVALPLARDNIDTDELIPVSENTRVSQTGWGDGLFAARRYLPGASGEAGRTPDPAFILNQPPFDRAAIVVAGANFGCGSSRESAVWALRDYGFRAVVAVSFNETFKRNCIINGLAPLAVPPADAARLAAMIARDPGAEVTVDLDGGTVSLAAPEPPVAFTLDPFYRALLTTGRTEDDMLADMQLRVDERRASLLQDCPWLRSGKDAASHALP